MQNTLGQVWRRRANAIQTQDDERGAVLYILAMFLVIFIGVAALAVDLASLGARGQDLQNTSDAAALAAVVEYQQRLIETGGDRSVAFVDAEARALEIIAQNNIDHTSEDITVVVTVVDDSTTTDPPQVTVSITDGDPDSFLPSGDLLGGVVRGGGDSTVQRAATAQFLACDNECAVTIAIPQPFGAVPAQGNGDGYKPIQVGNDLYAINHNSPGQALVCIDRVTQAPCWADANGDPQVSRSAYASSVGYNDRNPEMPQTGVVGSRIYWAATDAANGLRLFCWDTSVDIACPTAFDLDNTLVRIDDGVSPLTSPKDENRGGGTVALDDKVFVFSDNHRIHCFDPSVGGVCAGYPNGGNPTALSVLPPNDPMDGNHGSSIDRIVDEDTGFIYSVLHIPNAQPIVDCSSPLADPAGRRVVVVNEETGRYLAASASSWVTATDIGGEAPAWWDVENAGADTLSFQSVAIGEYLDSDPFVGTSVDFDVDNEWNSLIDGDAYFIDSEFFGGGLFDDAGNSGAVIEEDPPTSPNARWNFYPWQCGDPASFVPAGPVSPDWFQSGTWLHCYDTGVVSGQPQPCPNFAVNGTAHVPAGTPSPIHLDGSRFSGRLWFHYTAGSAIRQGVCSSGYDEAFTPSEIEVTCVDLASGNYSDVMTVSMNPVRDQIQGWTGTTPGAWGDPHWNDATNRLFYPTEHDTSRIICFDFDSGPCTSITGVLPPNAAGLVGTEDYGFISDGDCVFALGHHYYFWAFRASDTTQECEPQPLPTTINRCPCGDGATFRWGELDFREVDLAPFEEFGVRIMFDNGPGSLPIFPSDGSFLSMKPGGADRLIPLDDLDIPAGVNSVSVEVFVTGIPGADLADMGEFEVRFAQRPRLVD